MAHPDRWGGAGMSASTDLFRQPVAKAAPVLRDARDEYLEGWRLGRRAARLAVAMLESEADRTGSTGLLVAAVRHIDEIDPPAVELSERSERLGNAIRAALALSDASLAPEAVAVLKDALQ